MAENMVTWKSEGGLVCPLQQEVEKWQEESGVGVKMNSEVGT